MVLRPVYTHRGSRRHLWTRGRRYERRAGSDDARRRAIRTDHPDFKGRLGFLITSDEEAKATHGTKLAIQALKDQGAAIDFAIVGEPSSSEVLGDTIRVGRRGSLNGTLTVKGQQGHVAYPETVINPIHLAAIAIEKLLATPLDQGHGLSHRQPYKSPIFMLELAQPTLCLAIAVSNSISGSTPLGMLPR